MEEDNREELREVKNYRETGERTEKVASRSSTLRDAQQGVNDDDVESI